jgi:hypothetical protein
MSEMALVDGRRTLLDADDWESQGKFAWSSRRGSKMDSRYAYRRVLIDGKRTFVYLHREIMNAPRGTHVDHINHDTLDNRKINLRVCTVSQNCMNQNRARNAKVPFKGIKKKPRCVSWEAAICVNRKNIYLGCRSTAKEAALLYDEAAEKYFGEFALTNKKLGLLGEELCQSAL